MSKRIVLTGGGTAGHVTPHLSLIPRLKEMGYEIHYIGTSGIEKQMIAKIPDIQYHEVKSGKLRRYSAGRISSILLRWSGALCRA